MATATKVALVTGAGTGIGKHSALALMREGYAVVLAGRRKDLLEATAAEGKATGSPSLVVPTDVSDPESFAPSSPRPRTPSAGSTSSSTTRASARLPCPWRSCPSKSGRRWWTPI